MHLKQFLFVLIFASVISCQSAYSQHKEMQLGIEFMPGISTIASPFTDVVYYRLSMNGGISIKKEIKENFFYLQSGIFLFDRGYRSTIVFTDINGNGGEIKSEEIQRFVNIPFLWIIKYKSFYAGMGPGFNYLVMRKFIVNGVLITKNDYSFPIRRNMFDAQFHAGIEKNINQYLSFSGEFFVSACMAYNFINYGIGLGINYRLKKTEKIMESK